MCYLHFYRRGKHRSRWCWTPVPGGCWIWLGRVPTTTGTTVWFTAKVRKPLSAPYTHTHSISSNVFLSHMCKWTALVQTAMLSVALSLTSISSAFYGVRSSGQRSIRLCFDKCHSLTFAVFVFAFRVHGVRPEDMDWLRTCFLMFHNFVEYEYKVRFFINACLDGHRTRQHVYE